MKKNISYILYILGIIILFFILNLLLKDDNGIHLGEKDFITYENELYSPEEIEKIENSKDYVTGLDHSYWDETEFSRVRTSYYDIELEEGQIYGIYGQDLTYAYNLYVNGELISSMGKVGKSADTSTPKTGAFTAYFKAKANNRIVIQRCNFVHTQWNSFDINIGKQDDINRLENNNYFRNALLVIILLTMGLVNFGIFAGLKSQTHFLLFALACFCLMINYLFTNPKLIMIIIPNLNWYAGHKIESCSLVAGAFFLILFFEKCFGKMRKPVRITGFILIGIAFLYYAVLPSMVYTKYSVFVSDVVMVFAIAGCISILFRALKNFKKLSVAQIYYLVSITLLMISAVLGALRIGPYLDLIKIALVLSDIILTIGLANDYGKTRENLEAAVQNEHILKNMNEDMERAMKLQNNFLAIMNHEMRTPLTVMAGYADKLKYQLGTEHASDSDEIKDLEFIKQEALRLGRIVERSEEGVLDASKNWDKSAIKVEEIFEAVKQFCIPICEKRHNKLEIESNNELIVQVNRDEMLQLFYNLVINASRHTENGSIALKAEKNQNDMVLLKITDDGDGMDEETIKHAFEMGYTKDGRHGLGLALCKDIVLKHNGSIYIEKNAEKGISVCVLLPEYKN